MTLNDYQELAGKTAIYPGKGEQGNPQGLTYTALGLTGEAGEVANKIKKVIRGDKRITLALEADIAAELGDVLWYTAMLASELGFGLEQIAEKNIQKLDLRKQNNAIMGDGDNR